MSQTRICCTKCGFPLCYCQCPKPESPSAGTVPEPVAPPLVGTGSMVGLRSLTFVCVGQGLTALAMYIEGCVGFETLSAAIYFPTLTLIGAWLMRREPCSPTVGKYTIS